MPASTRQYHAPSGFTLVEIILVVSLIGILIFLALPSYSSVLLRAHRSEAMSQMMQVATCQERTRAMSGAYDTLRCLPGSSHRYRFAYSETSIPAYYRVEARPIGAQADDPCGTLLLDALGRKSVSATSADAVICWAGR